MHMCASTRHYLQYVNLDKLKRPRVASLKARLLNRSSPLPASVRIQARRAATRTIIYGTKPQFLMLGA